MNRAIAPRKKVYKEWAWLLSAMLIPLLLATILTYPVITDIGHRLPGWEGDNVEFVWFMHWARYALLNGKNFFFDAGAFYPVGFNYAEVDLSPINLFGALPITLLFGPVVAYNVALFATFVLTSLFTFLWVKTSTHNAPIALLCGIVSAFFPYRIAHLPGHLNLITTQWFPMGFWAIEHYLQSHRQRWLIIMSIALALAGLSAWYYLIFAAIAFGIYLMAGSLRIHRLLADRTFWKPFAFGALLSGILIAPFAIPHLQAQVNTNDLRRPFSDVLGLSVSPIELITPSVRHPLLGNWILQVVPGASNQNIVERVVTPGFVLLVLGVMGILLSRRRTVVRAMIFLIVIAVVISLGPLLIGTDHQPVRLPVTVEEMTFLRTSGVMGFLSSWFTPELAAQMQAGLFVVVPLPFAFVYKLPIVWSLRGVARASILMDFGLCALAGLGLAELWRRFPRFSQAGRLGTLLGLGILILFEYWQSPYGAANLQIRPVDVWLSSQPMGSVLELPVEQGSRAYGLFARTIHNQPTVLGTSVSYRELASRKQVIKQLPESASLQMLCEWDVRYIVVDTSRVKPEQLEITRAVIRAIPHLSSPIRVGSADVYQMAPCRN
jgi:hypothetical protein